MTRFRDLPWFAWDEPSKSSALTTWVMFTIAIAIIFWCIFIGVPK